MIDRELQERLTNQTRTIVDKIIDMSLPLNEIFDEFCNRIDDWCKEIGYKAYIRVFWYDETDLDQCLDEVMEMNEDYLVEAYCNYPSVEIDACFTVILYKERR